MSDSGHSVPQNTLQQSWLKETLALRGNAQELPVRVFKFLSTSTPFFRLSLHELLIHSTIYLSARSDFNDPFDSKVVLKEWVSSDIAVHLDQIEHFRGLPIDPTHKINLAKNCEVWNQKRTEVINETLDTIGVYSLCEEIFDPLMWSHYANGHKGIALIFSTGENRGSLGQLPIRYQDARPVVGADPDNLRQMLLHSLVKDDRWKYEREWRIWEPGRARTQKQLSPNLLSGIIYGARCDPSAFHFLQAQIQQRAELGLPPIRQFLAEVNKQNFNIDFYEQLQTGERIPAVF